MPLADRGMIPKDALFGIALTAILFAVSTKLPVIGFFFAMFIPLPILYCRVKLGRNWGAAAALGAAVAMVLFSGGLSAELLFFFELAFLGFVMGELFILDLSVEKTVGYASCAVLGTAVAFLLLLGLMTGTGIPTMASQYVETNLRMTLRLYESVGMPEESIHVIARSLETLRYVLVRILPALAAASTLFVVWSNLLLTRPLLTAKRLFYPSFGPLNRWKAPEVLVWGAIGCAAMLLLPHKGIKMAGLNGMILLMTVYFFQGIAIVSYYFNRKGFPRALRIFLYSLIALQQFLLIIVIGIGFFDVWLNLRRIKRNDGMME